MFINFILLKFILKPDCIFVIVLTFNKLLGPLLRTESILTDQSRVMALPLTLTPFIMELELAMSNGGNLYLNGR